MKNHETNSFTFFTKYVYICLTHFCEQFKISPKIARGKS